MKLKGEIIRTDLDIALARANSQALLEELTERKRDISFGRVRVGRTRVLGDVETRNSETTCGANNGDETLENDIRLLSVAVGTDSLVSDGVDATINLSSAE